MIADCGAEEIPEPFSVTKDDAKAWYSTIYYNAFIIPYFFNINFCTKYIKYMYWIKISHDDFWFFNSKKSFARI